MTSQQASAVVVDTRYQGAHGIARYSREIVARLAVKWEPLETQVSLGGGGELWNRDRLKLPSSSLLYSPGFFAGFARCRQLLTIHDLIHLQQPSGALAARNRLYYDAVLRPAIVRTGTVITVSATSADKIRGWLGTADVRVVNAGNGCAPIFREDGDPADLGRPYFLYVGNLKTHKNPTPAFQAVAAFRDHLLVVVTSDVVRATQLATDSGILDRTIVRTEVSDIELRALYQGSEALLFPSVVEGFGLPVVEALSAGAKVVFYSGADSVKEICGDSQFEVSDQSSVEEFVEAMTQAAETAFTPPPGLERYDWSRVAERVNSTITEVRDS